MSINREEFTNFLEEFLLEEEAKELEIKITGSEEEDSPTINSLQKANYFLKLIKNIDEDIKSIEELCKEEVDKTIKRIGEYKESQIKPMLAHREYYMKLLKNFTMHEIANSKKKSIKLPNGTLSISKQKPMWEYDEDTILNWLSLNHGDKFISRKIEEKIDKNELKKNIVLDDNNIPTLEGTEVPGLVITEREDKFTVK